MIIKFIKSSFLLAFVSSLSANAQDAKANSGKARIKSKKATLARPEKLRKKNLKPARKKQGLKTSSSFCQIMGNYKYETLINAFFVGLGSIILTALFASRKRNKASGKILPEKNSTNAKVQKPDLFSTQACLARQKRALELKQEKPSAEKILQQIQGAQARMSQISANLQRTSLTIAQKERPAIILQVQHTFQEVKKVFDLIQQALKAIETFEKANTDHDPEKIFKAYARVKAIEETDKTSKILRQAQEAKAQLLIELKIQAHICLELSGFRPEESEAPQTVAQSLETWNSLLQEVRSIALCASQLSYEVAIK